MGRRSVGMGAPGSSEQDSSGIGGVPQQLCVSALIRVRRSRHTTSAGEFDDLGTPCPKPAVFRRFHAQTGSTIQAHDHRWRVRRFRHTLGPNSQFSAVFTLIRVRRSRHMASAGKFDDLGTPLHSTHRFPRFPRSDGFDDPGTPCPEIRRLVLVQGQNGHCYSTEHFCSATNRSDRVVVIEMRPETAILRSGGGGRRYTMIDSVTAQLRD
jgi:hypothetical protein